MNNGDLRWTLGRCMEGECCEFGTEIIMGNTG